MNLGQNPQIQRLGFQVGQQQSEWVLFTSHHKVFELQPMHELHGGVKKTQRFRTWGKYLQIRVCGGLEREMGSNHNHNYSNITSKRLDAQS